MDYYPANTDPPPATTAERDAMVRIAERWETAAATLADAIVNGAQQHPAEIKTLWQCASELRQAMRVGRPGAQSAGPAPDVDPLGHVAVGDPDPNPDEPKGCCGSMSHRTLVCTRAPHPARWQHIASTTERVVAVWTDPQSGSAAS